LDALRILVVDDEPGMRLGVARALRDVTVKLPEHDQEVSLEISQAATGEEAMELIRASAPDILLLDYKLPGISGLDVLDSLEGPEDRTLTVMLTAYASLETAITATKRGAYDFLAKPFTPDELKAVVRKAAKHLLLQRQARRLEQEKRQVRFQFISVLAHELKAPIAAVEGYLHILKARSAGEDLAAYDQMLSRSLVRLGGMRKLIGDLLDLTRIESGQKKRELTQVDLAALAAACVETFAGQAAEKGVALALHGGGVTMTADRGELEIIVNNLLSNAIKYNRKGGRADVTLSARDGVVTIVAADTGIGMTNEEAGRLFVEFSRIKNEKTRNVLGSGLGLSIVKKLSALYDGDVTATSRPDVGTTFTVTLKHDLQERT
jgi:two-component system, sensor histidine kinase and response regulator